MPYLGSIPPTSFQSLSSQTLTGNGGTSYTLNTSVSSAADVAVFVNNVRQNPNSSYTASGTSLSMSAAVSGSDNFYVVYLGKAVGTINPASGSVGSSTITAEMITGQTELSSQPADTDEFIVSDAGVLKRIDYSLIKATSTHVKLASATVSSAVGEINFANTFADNSSFRVFYILGESLEGSANAYRNWRFSTNGTNGDTSGYSWAIDGRNSQNVGISWNTTSQNYATLQDNNYIANAGFAFGFNGASVKRTGCSSGATRNSL